MITIFTIEKFLWLSIGIYWLASAFNGKKTIKHQADLQRILYMCLWIIAFLLLFSNNISISFLYKPLFSQQLFFKITGLIFCMAGLLFSVWARVCIGRNWSGRISVKKNHELVTTGAYAVTRNPIYTGFLAAFAGCAMTEGLAKGYLSLFFIIAGIMIKIRKEESYMNQVFKESFHKYKQRVKRLVPFIY
ncbi:MAG: isoprenylcysteine carboxylmethyltransferase family protein [Bacteroidota bacterium]|nr:isoprenylcysteine carboxylmethyltransferase family protein [Bacteroidota bacterium]